MQAAILAVMFAFLAAYAKYCMLQVIIRFITALLLTCPSVSADGLIERSPLTDASGQTSNYAIRIRHYFV